MQTINISLTKTTPPMPRWDGGKCGTVLAAEQILKGMGITRDTIDAFDNQFTEQFGSLKCSELRGMLCNKCNDYVGTATSMVAAMIEE